MVTPLSSEPSVGKDAVYKIEVASRAADFKQEAAPSALEVELALTPPPRVASKTLPIQTIQVPALTSAALDTLEDGVPVTKYGTIVLENVTKYRRVESQKPAARPRP